MGNPFDTTPDNRNNDAEIAKILALGTDREQTQQLLQDLGSDAYLFNSSAATFKNGTAGKGVFLQAETWPTLKYRNANIGAVIVVLAPCAINPLHTHKTTELQFNIGPGRMQSFFVESNGLSVVNNIKDAGSVTLFPEGSMHMEMNIDCKPTTFFSAFPDPDFSRVDMAQIVNFGSDILNATFSGFGTENLVPPSMDQGVAIRGTAECRQRCGLPDDYDLDALYPNLGFFTQDWFNPEVFFSTLSPPGSANSSYAAPQSPPSRRHLGDTSEVLNVAESDMASGGALHALKDYMSLSAMRIGGPEVMLNGAGPSSNPLEPVVYGLSFVCLALFSALVLSFFGYGRRGRYGGEIKF